MARPLASYYLLLSAVGLLLCIGLVMVFSATMVESYAREGNAFAVIVQQATWAAIGLVAFWVAQRLPVRTYRSLARPMLVLSLVLGLILVLIPYAGQSAAVSTYDRWIYIGPIQLQPSEIAKFALLLWAADILVKAGPRLGSWRDLAVPLFPIAGVLMVLVGYSDLGTMLIMVLMFLAMLFTAGVRLRIITGLLTLAFVGSVFLIFAASRRMERILSFRNPEEYQDTWGWQAIQGYYAISDGGWFGVGLGESRQKWEWLPNGHNDFIFALIAEELGVFGCLVVLGLFCIVIYAGFRIARRVEDPFRRVVASGCTVWLTGQTVINIGGVIGLLPITGVPLPFISDGGTALVMVLAAVGMLASFARAEPDAARALRARNPSRLTRLLWAPLPPLPREPGSSRTGGPSQRSTPGQKTTSRRRSDAKK
ncbi:putative lipid II flippase FtsW [Natronoglycomyces albus]|nr:putative lipid II flippase FtsW [Natronoglycomyces albus]